MAAKGLNVKDREEIRRLKAMGFGKRKIARTLGVHRNTVSKYFDELCEMSATAPPLPTDVLAAKASSDESWTGDVDWQAVRNEALGGVPINIIYEELVEHNKVTVQYPAFWKQLQKRAPMLKTTMVRIFAPGSAAEIDYCDGIRIVDVTTGEMLKTELFVGVLCQSLYVCGVHAVAEVRRLFIFARAHARVFWRRAASDLAGQFEVGSDEGSPLRSGYKSSLHEACHALCVRGRSGAGEDATGQGDCRAYDPDFSALVFYARQEPDIYFAAGTQRRS